MHGVVALKAHTRKHDTRTVVVLAQFLWREYYHATGHSEAHCATLDVKEGLGLSIACVFNPIMQAITSYVPALSVYHIQAVLTHHPQPVAVIFYGREYHSATIAQPLRAHHAKPRTQQIGILAKLQAPAHGHHTQPATAQGHSLQHIIGHDALARRISLRHIAPPRRRSFGLCRNQTIVGGKDERAVYPVTHTPHLIKKVHRIISEQLACPPELHTPCLLIHQNGTSTIGCHPYTPLIIDVKIIYVAIRQIAFSTSFDILAQPAISLSNIQSAAFGTYPQPSAPVGHQRIDARSKHLRSLLQPAR